MAGKTFPLRLLMLLFLCVSQNLVCLNAIPVTRIRSLQHNLHGFQVTEEINEGSVGIFSPPERMDLEINDYPGSGANKTPKAQLEEVCSTENC